MADTQISPISQLLSSLGLTREDLHKHSDQMRQFLTAEDSNSLRVLDNVKAVSGSNTISDTRPGSKGSTSSRSMARSISRASSMSFRDASPPATPVKPEPVEGGLPLRRIDSMEVVIERQRRQNRKEKKARRERERGTGGSMGLPPHPPSPSPTNASHTGLSLDSFMKSRDGRRVTVTGEDTNDESGVLQANWASLPPVTPQKNNYYRDHTSKPSTIRAQKATFSPKHESPTPTQQGYRLKINDELPLPSPRFRDLQASSQNPITPKHRRTQELAVKSPLPGSSPPTSSPVSSPARGIVNLVSSPGPMGPPPLEEEYETLPYTLPPGPYSSKKPDLSYAALVGQAILSSPEHRLTLQEIYDWMTIVYPHFKRGETTWMNSIRHVLSTTICFRKVTRERSVGRTLWAIWDEDLECFKDGGFRKQFCADMCAQIAKDKSNKTAKGKKRSALEVDDVAEAAGNSSEPRKPVKRARKEKEPAASSAMPLSAGPTFHPTYIMPPLGMVHHSHSLPIFPPPRSMGPHHQPYYETCLSQPMPVEVIFPPLPPSSAYHRLPTSVSSASASASASVSDGTTGTDSDSSPVLLSYPAPSSASSSSVPDLVPHSSSSSPPDSMPPTSEMDLSHDHHHNTDHTEASRATCQVNNTAVQVQDVDDDDMDDDDGVFNTSVLGPVQFWGDTTPRTPTLPDALEPGITLLNYDYGFGKVPEEQQSSQHGKKAVKTKTKRKQEKAPSKKALALPPMPTSPTLARRAAAVASSSKSSNKVARTSPSPTQTHTTSQRPSTPTSQIETHTGPYIPSTPPRKNRELQISAIRTPLSHKGLHMSPTASLAHYKSHLDPPPIAGPSGSGGDDEYKGGKDDELMRTPSRKRTTSTPGAFQPVTPKRQSATNGNASESPFRTPSSASASGFAFGFMGQSPFRTPGSRGIFDPHDPGALLDEELSRMGAAGHGDSPAGLFGRGKGALLYESPNPLETSPGTWKRWW